MPLSKTILCVSHPLVDDGGSHLTTRSALLESDQTCR